MEYSADEEGIFEISLDRLLELSDPTLDDPWGCGKIITADVFEALEHSEQISTLKAEDRKTYLSYSYNVGRIAYFLKDSWREPEFDYEPITVDIGTAGYTPLYFIADGNHRVAAAKLRGDSTIRIELMGDLAKAEAVFYRGVDPVDYSPMEDVDSA